MGARKILILFFSTMSVSLVTLIILFNLFFKNVDLDIETKTPESAPTIEVEYPATDSPELSKDNDNGKKNINHPDFKAKSVTNSKVRVPGHVPPSDNDEDKDRTDNPDADLELLPGDGPLTEPPPANANQPMAPKVVNSSGQLKSPPMPMPKPKVPDGSTTQKPQKTALYQVYLDGFSSEDAARAKVDSLKAQGIDAFVNTSGGTPVVKLGTFSSRSSAESLASQNGAKVREVR